MNFFKKFLRWIEIRDLYDAEKQLGSNNQRVEVYKKKLTKATHPISILFYKLMLRDSLRMQRGYVRVVEKKKQYLMKSFWVNA